MKIFILSLVCLLFSCTEKNIKREILQLQSQKILIPTDSMLHQINGRDTILGNTFDISIKLVVYSDSSICSSCALQALNKWDSFIQKANKSQGKLQLFFIFSPRKREVIQVKNMIATYALDYPVFIDTMKIFTKYNPHLPMHPMFHIFLLDEEDQVIVVGNPLKNKKLSAIYEKTINKKLSEIE